MKAQFIGYRDSPAGIVAEVVLTLNRGELAAALQVLSITDKEELGNAMENWPRTPTVAKPKPRMVFRDAPLEELIGKTFSDVGVEGAGDSDDDMWRMRFECGDDEHYLLCTLDADLVQPIDDLRYLLGEPIVWADMSVERIGGTSTEVVVFTFEIATATHSEKIQWVGSGHRRMVKSPPTLTRIGPEEVDA